MSKPPQKTAKKSAAKAAAADKPARAKAKKAAPKKAEAPAAAAETGTEKAKPVKPAADKPAPASDAALEKRLAEMTDFQLRAYHTSTTQISRNPGHVKSTTAQASLPLIEAEIARRKVSPDRAPSPVRAAVASPKTGAKSGKSRD
mgnify:CR=1 FL=1